MQRAAQDYVKKCDQCQRYTPNIHQPRGILNPLLSPCPFAHWGLDIVVPFLRAAGNRRWLIVRTNYFIKWVETEPLSNIKDANAKRFVWRSIVTRFGIPHTLISDNRLQFDSKAYRRYCGKLGFRNRYSTPTYPQGNGQAEVVNKVIVNGLKKRLDEAKGRWVDELPHVLWTYHTTPWRSTGETPFSMTYASEVDILLKTGFPTLRISQFNIEENNSLLSASLDLVDKRREVVMVQMAHY